MADDRDSSQLPVVSCQSDKGSDRFLPLLRTDPPAPRVPGQLATALIRLWRVYAYLDLMWMTRDLKQFLMYWFSDLILNIGAVTATLLLAERFAGIGAWSKEQVIFMLGYATLAKGLLEMFFGYNVLYISRRLGRGQLDHTLLQPQPLWLALLTEGFTPFSQSAILLPGLGLMVWATAHLSLVVTAAWLARVLLSLAASSVVVLAYTFLWGSLAFWAPRAAEEVNSSSLRLIYQLKPFPLDGVGPVLLGGLMSVLPVGFVAWYPCRSLLGLAAGERGILITCLAAAVLAVLASWAFRRGLKQYGRTGSQRYLSFGHRR
jgi:ABC-2 type transport system permease protein